MRDRSASAPYDLNVPVARRYLPGTMVLETSWGTTSGWIIVRDLLLMGPWHHEDELSRTHRRAPTDYDADHVLLRTVRCVNGEVQVVLDCEPMFDYGRQAVQWSYTDRGYHQGVARAEGIDLELTLTTDLRLGFEGGRATARTLLKEGESRFCALSWSEHPPPTTFDERVPAPGLDRSPLAALAGSGKLPRPPVAALPAAQRPHAEGADVRPDGRARRRSHDVAAGDARRASATGTIATRWIRDSTFALWALYTLGFDWEANDFFWFIADVAERDEELQVMYGVDGEAELPEQVLEHLEGYEGARPVRIGNARVQAAAARRVGRGARLGVPPHQVSRPARRAHLVDPEAPGRAPRSEHWREPDRGMWEVRGASAALHVVEADVLGGRRPGRQAWRS